MSSLPNNLIAELLGIPPATLKQRVEAKASEAFDILVTRLDKPNLTRPRIVYDLKGRLAGMAVDGRTIRVNLQLLNDPRYTEDMIENTVPHEVAHCVQRQLWPHSQSHGHQWQRLMYLLGLEPTRCHEYEVQPARKHPRPHIYMCSCLGQYHKLTNRTHASVLRGNERICKKCRNVITYAYSE